MVRICFLVGVLQAASAATLGPHLFKDAEGPKVLRGLFPSKAAPEKIIEPFVGESYPLVRVHRDGDKKSGDDATTEALVSKLKDQLPGDAFGTLARAAAPVSVVLQFEHLARDFWPEEIVDLAGPFGPTNPRADSEGGLFVHAYASSPGAAALAEHSDTGDVLVVQLAGSKTFTFGGEAVTLARGDGLVLPSGTRHAARAADDEASLHVTLHNFVPHKHLVTWSRRRLLEYADDDDEYADDDATNCWDYEGSDKYCHCHCNECTSCSDADTVCDSEIPEGYNREKYDVCCLSFGYRIEQDPNGNCDGYDDLITPLDDETALELRYFTAVKEVTCTRLDHEFVGPSAAGGSAIVVSASDGDSTMILSYSTMTSGLNLNNKQKIVDVGEPAWLVSANSKEEIAVSPGDGTMVLTKGSRSFHTVDYSGPAPVAIAPVLWTAGAEAKRHVAVLDSVSRQIVVYEEGATEMRLLEAFSLDLSGVMAEVKQMTYDAAASAIYVGGVVQGAANRGVARVDVKEDDGLEFAWVGGVAPVDVKTGTPRLLLRGSAELLLLSKHFYARVDTATGATTFLRVEDNLFLPEDDGVQAAYDPIHDCIYSTSIDKIKRHDVDTGDAVWRFDWEDALSHWADDRGEDLGVHGMESHAIHVTDNGLVHLVAQHGDTEEGGYHSCFGVSILSFASGAAPTPAPRSSSPTAAATPLPTTPPTPPPSTPASDGAGGRTATSFLVVVAIALAHYAL